MSITGEEIRHRLTGFVETWSAYNGSERAEAPRSDLGPCLHYRDEAAQLGPDDTVVAVISGNGYKTLDEHPDKPWPEMVACEVEAMEQILAEFRRSGAGAVLPS